MTRPFYLIESFQDVKRDHGTLFVLTKWVGYVKPTWEPVSQLLIDVPRELSAFVMNDDSPLLKNRSKRSVVHAIRAIVTEKVPLSINVYEPVTTNSDKKQNNKN